MTLFNFIKSQISILNVINEYTTLRQAGIYWKGICPFHNEKTPSFTVSPHRNIFYCFGCHIGGDVVSFIAKAENCSQFEAAKFLTDKFSLSVPKEINKELKTTPESADEKDKYFFICQLVANWCHENLKNNKQALDYITNRGFNSENIDKYLIGYFPGGFNSIKIFLKTLTKYSILAQDLIKISILMESKSNLYSPFEERIIFPIKDSLGRFCGFGGRVFKQNDERAKYYNSHENHYFNKGSILFGLDLAKKHIQDKGYAFLVEGYTDCIAMAQYGYKNTVAVLGTACTIDHLKNLSRFTQIIYVLYDADEAGHKAILRLTEMCWNVNLELRVICLEDKEDPASFLNKKGNLEKLISNAKDIYTFFIENSGKNFSSKTLNEKIWTVKKLIDIIQNISDPIKRDILLQEISNKLNIPIDSIKNNIKNETKQINSTKIIFKNDINEESVSNLEKRLFSTIMNNFDLFNSSLYYLVDFFNAPFKDILDVFIRLKINNNKLLFNDFWEYLDDEQKNFVNRTLLEYEEDISKNFADMITQFQKKNWKKITNYTKHKLIEAQKNLDNQTAAKIISEYEKLKLKFINGGGL